MHRPCQGAKVRTQQIYRIGDEQKRVRVDVVIRLLTEDGATDTLVFIECKFNPDEDDHAHWFPPEQEPDQLTALRQEASGAERRLVAIVSDRDLENPARPVPKEYEHVLGWREIAELAGRAGGPGGWQEPARDASAHAKQRVLLEIWAYLKGDVVGALEDDDLVAIGRADQAWNRVYAVLERVSEILGWDAVDDDWTTLEGTTSVNYIGTEAPDHSWLDRFGLQNGVVHHTYSTYNRGVEALMGFYQYLDLAPAGRNEDTLEFPQASWRRHDEYGLP